MARVILRSGFRIHRVGYGGRSGVSQLGPIINGHRRVPGGPFRRPGSQQNARSRGLGSHRGPAGVNRRRGAGRFSRQRNGRNVGNSGRRGRRTPPVVGAGGTVGAPTNAGNGASGGQGAVVVQGLAGGSVASGATNTIGRRRSARLNGLPIPPNLVPDRGFFIESPIRNGHRIKIPGLKPHICEAVGRFFNNFYLEIVQALGINIPYTINSNTFICDPNALRRFVDEYNKKIKAVKRGEIQLAIPATFKAFVEAGKISVTNIIHVLDFAYKMSIPDPQVLNAGKSRSETYGETSYLQIASILKELKITNRTKLLDMGSGIGNLVMFAALASRIRSAYGIESVKLRADLATEQKKWLSRILRHLGKREPHYELFKDSFLEEKYGEIIQEANIIFINNYVFSDELMSKIENILLIVKDGTQIVTTKPLQLGTRRTPGQLRPNAKTDLNDLKTFVTTTPLEMVKDGVSWTGNECQFYLNVVKRLRPAIVMAM